MSTLLCYSTRCLSAAVLVAWSSCVFCGGCNVAAGGYNADGVRLFQQGQSQAALQQFQKAISSDPRNADAYYNLAATLHRQGIQQNKQEYLTQAETLYNQCLDLNPNHTDCYRGLAVLLVDTKRSDKAMTLMKNWANANPKSSDARVELARLYEEYGDKETAQLQLNQAIQLDPNNARAWAALGHQREQAGDLSQALANYQRSYSINRSQPLVAERITALNQKLALATPGSIAPASPTAPGSSDTRLATPPPATTKPPRY